MRHSFGLRMCLLLAVASNPGSRDFGTQVSATLPGWDASWALADQLRANLLWGAELSRRNLWAVCVLLGHSGPDVSVEHYIHHLDILLAQSLACAPIAPVSDVVILASGASTAQAYRHKSDATLDGWAAHLFKKRFVQDVKQPDKVQPMIAHDSRPSNAQASDAADSLDRIWRQNLLVQTGKRSTQEISESSGIDMQRIEAYVQSARWLLTLKMFTGGTKLRHRFT